MYSPRMAFASDILPLAEDAIGACENILALPDYLSSEDHAFVDQLCQYLIARASSQLLREKDLEKRASWVLAFLPLLQGKERQAQLQALAEDQILGFAGFFSRRFYRLLRERRIFLEGEMAHLKRSEKQELLDAFGS